MTNTTVPNDEMTTVCTNLIPDSIYEKLPGQISGGGGGIQNFRGIPQDTCLE